MISPTEQDIGRGVVYCLGYGKREDGVITKLIASGDYVFVRYAGDAGAKPTFCRHLNWLSDQPQEHADENPSQR